MKRRIAALLIALAGSTGAASFPPKSQCVMTAADKGWAESALHAWEFVRANRLLLPRAARPTIILFDSACRFEAAPGAGLRWTGTPHGGEIRVPGMKIPPEVTSFAGPGGRGKPPFFVMALPAVWRAAGIQSNLGLEVLMEAVLVHEIMHTRQSYFATPRLDALTKQYGLGEDINDDSLQERFKSDPAYVAAYERERDLLYAAAAEPDRARAQALARQALEAMRARQARWFIGADARWKPLEDIFLTMEGVGQWAGYAWLSDPHGRGLDKAFALKEMRRSGKWWSQEEGLALFLLVDRLLPGWQRNAFAAKPMMGIDLLAAAVATSR